MTSSVSSFAGTVLKMIHAWGQPTLPVTDEEIQNIQQLAAIMTAQLPTPKPMATAAAAPGPAPREKKLLKKLQKATTVERALLEPVELETPSNTAPSNTPHTLHINPSLCQARKVNDKEFIPGTEADKVYAEAQCMRKKQADSDFCKFCAATHEKWRSSGGKEKKWAGRVDEPIPDHLHILGSAWFKKTYPRGLETATTGGHITSPPPATDVVLDDSVPIQVLEWEAFSFQGSTLIRHMKDGRVYKADMSKEGMERIVFSQFQGRWKDGDLDIYGLEEEEEED